MIIVILPFQNHSLAWVGRVWGLCYSLKLNLKFYHPVQFSKENDYLLGYFIGLGPLSILDSWGPHKIFIFYLLMTSSYYYYFYAKCIYCRRGLYTENIGNWRTIMQFRQVQWWKRDFYKLLSFLSSTIFISSLFSVHSTS